MTFAVGDHPAAVIDRSDRAAAAAAASGQKLPWPFTAAALVAFAAMYVTGNRFVGMPLIAVLFVGSQFTSVRLPRAPVLTWVVRVAVWAFFLSISPQRRPSGLTVIYDPNYVNLFGYFCAAELALRAWTRAERGPSRGDAMLLTTLVFAAASNTYEGHIRWLAPVWAVFTVLALRAFNRRPAPGGAPDRFESPPAWHRHRPSLVGLRATALVTALLLSAASVWAVTRYEYKITQWAVDLLQKGTRGRGEIGLSAGARLQAVFNPSPSLTRVAVIDGKVEERHLRVLAYDTYHDTVWFPQFAERGFRAASPMPAASRTWARITVTRLEDLEALLPLPLNAARIECEFPLEQDALGGVRSPDDVGSPYTVVLGPAEDSQGPLCTPPNEGQRERLLAVPGEVDRKVVELAKGVATAPDAAGKLRQIEGYLRATHAYSLSYQPQGEPLSDFLLHDRAAHCQYFAAGAVMMARAVGVPARFVTGYYAHESEGENQMVVRERDAHAWAEAWVEGTGWVTVDATPAGGRPSGLFPRPSPWRRAWERVHDLPGVLRDLLVKYTATVLMIAALPAAVVALTWVLKRVLRKKKVGPDEAYAAPVAELREAAARFTRILAKEEIVVPANRTWRDYLARREVYQGFLAAYDRARFGRGSAEQFARVDEVLRELEGTQRSKEASA